MVERRFPKPDVVGSSPTGRAIFLLYYQIKKQNMVRVKRGSVARKRRNKILKNKKRFGLFSKTNFRIVNQKNLKSKILAYNSRKEYKRFVRSLWINRINSSIKLNGLSFSKFINFCKNSKIQLNRKILSQLLIYDSQSFFDYFQINYK